MTPARRRFALTRLERLNKTLNQINDLLAARKHSGHPQDIRAREALTKQRNSTTTAIKRWQKLLAEDNPTQDDEP